MKFKLPKYISIICITCLLFISAQQVAKAQVSEITFKVNLKPQLEDSVFIPGRDNIKIVGNLHPINSPTSYYLVDEPPIDSIYSITIRFSPRFRNQVLTYNFVMTADYTRYTEVMPRKLQLLGNKVELDPLYFNAFAW